MPPTADACTSCGASHKLLAAARLAVETRWRQAIDEGLTSLQSEKGGGGGNGGGGGGGGEAEAAALTWKLETEKAVREGERWKSAARRSEELLRQREHEAMTMRVQLEDARLAVERKALHDEASRADEGPLNEMRSALASARAL